MSNFFKYFYFFSKLATNFVLLGIIIFLGYIFAQSYNSNDKLASNFEDQLGDFTHTIQENTNSIILLNNKILENSKNLEESSINLEKKIQDNFSEKYLSKLDNLYTENKILLNKIEKLSNEIYNLKSISPQTNNNFKINQKDKVTNNLINLIKLKYENGLNVKEELLMVKNLNSNNLNEQHITKLIILADNKFVGLDVLKDDFEKLMKEYLNLHFIKQNNNFLIRYMANFITIEPNNKQNYNNNILENFSKIKTKLKNKEIKSALKDLTLIQDSEKYFKNWLNQANYYLNFFDNLNKLPTL